MSNPFFSMRSFYRRGALLALVAIFLQIEAPLVHTWQESAALPCAHILQGSGLQTPEDPSHHAHDPMACEFCSSSAYSKVLAVFPTWLLIVVPRSQFHFLRRPIEIALGGDIFKPSARAPPEHS